MKVFFKQSIADKINREFAAAQLYGKEIERIELDQKEWTSFLEEMAGKCFPTSFRFDKYEYRGAIISCTP